MDGWDLVRYIHLLAMAFFVGGQIMLAAVLAPMLRGKPEMTAIAKRFGIGSGIALLVLVVTGMMMASDLGQWSNPWLHAKLTFLVILIGLLAYHGKVGRQEGKRWLEPAMGVSTLLIVFCAVGLAHG